MFILILGYLQLIIERAPRQTREFKQVYEGKLLP